MSYDTEFYKHILIKSASALDSEIADTLTDLYEKARCLHVYKSTPLMLDDMLSISSKYLERIGITAPNLLGSGITISSENDELISMSDKPMRMPRYGYLKDTDSTADKDGHSASAAASVSIKKEEFIPTVYTPLFVECEGDTKKALDSSVSISPVLVSAFAANGAENGFSKGISIVLDSLFELIARGADIEDSGYTLKLGLPSEPEDEASTVAFALSSILGAYRVAIELCLPDRCSEIVATEDTLPSLFCAAYTDKSTKNVPKRFANADSGVYLFAFRRKNNTTPAQMPDFESVRKMLSYVQELMGSGDVLSACAFNGALDASVAKMETDELTFAQEDGANVSDIFAQGIIVESAKNVGGIKIGTVKNRSFAEVEE